MISYCLCCFFKKFFLACSLSFCRTGLQAQVPSRKKLVPFSQNASALFHSKTAPLAPPVSLVMLRGQQRWGYRSGQLLSNFSELPGKREVMSWQSLKIFPPPTREMISLCAPHFTTPGYRKPTTRTVRAEAASAVPGPRLLLFLKRKQPKHWPLSSSVLFLRKPNLHKQIN